MLINPDMPDITGFQQEGAMGASLDDNRSYWLISVKIPSNAGLEHRVEVDRSRKERT
jgi:hypothetical protein